MDLTQFSLDELEIFADSLRNYITARKYQETTAHDLVQELDQLEDELDTLSREIKGKEIEVSALAKELQAAHAAPKIIHPEKSAPIDKSERPASEQVKTLPLEKADEAVQAENSWPLSKQEAAQKLDLTVNMFSRHVNQVQSLDQGQSLLSEKCRVSQYTEFYQADLTLINDVDDLHKQNLKYPDIVQQLLVKTLGSDQAALSAAVRAENNWPKSKHEAAKSLDLTVNMFSRHVNRVQSLDQSQSLLSEKCRLSQYTDFYQTDLTLINDVDDLHKQNLKYPDIVQQLLSEAETS